MSRVPVAVLGATGTVGQRLVSLLSRHPWFELAELCGGSRSAGQRYGQAVRWLLPGDVPAAATGLTVLPAGVELRSRIVFSAVDAAVADQLEPRYASRGHVVVSNARSFRLDPEVPLVIPEINPGALGLLDRQRWASSGGGIVTNPNCSAVGLTLALAPLQARFGIQAVVVVTLQALSGAGYPGVAALDAAGNVIPHIEGEEEKIAAEPLKILDASFPISVAVHRVPVVDGHSEAVFVKLRCAATVAEIRAELEGFRGIGENPWLPSAPERPLHVFDAPDRPQPARDLDRGDGMVVSIGRLRPDPCYDVRFNLLVHNTVRGAAGAALLNAELLLATGRVEAGALQAVR